MLTMTKESTSRLAMPEFIAIPVLIRETNESDNYMGVVMKGVAAQISLYYPAFMNEKECTRFVIAGGLYLSSLSFSEFDELIKSADRSYNVDSVETT